MLTLTTLFTRAGSWHLAASQPARGTQHTTYSCFNYFHRSCQLDTLNAIGSVAIVIPCCVPMQELEDVLSADRLAAMFGDGRGGDEEGAEESEDREPR